ncbi:hypothetical protein SLEP1_g31474 [Rubroshorea leprosula]|uniref:Glycosyltransferase n=1 Tax=Rubroshorea leprosula TaxID=152421 RepID=A0AAV5K9X2_9ROSI|nr:hypothetical protein SLEP1_g31474 [Rubroshorea leprosula]
MNKVELFFISISPRGHIVPMEEVAKHLVHQNSRFSITVLIIKTSFETNTIPYDQPVHDRIRFIYLSLPQNQNHDLNRPKLIESHKPLVKEAVTTTITSSNDSVLAGRGMLKEDEDEVYITRQWLGVGEVRWFWYNSGAATLSLCFHLQALHDSQNIDITEFNGSNAELPVPSFRNPVPAKVLPSSVLHKDRAAEIFGFTRRFRETKGIMVNSFMELESQALNSLSSDPQIPPVYPVGPVLTPQMDGQDHCSDIMKWLDDQAPLSVVFLCFGSMGSFGEDQVKEIACALEQSGHRFRWSLRKPPPKGTMQLPTDYSNLEEILPKGFLDRTGGIGKVIGWAPQVEILAHSAIGGFVSHCGWNSTLESIWFGVPIAAWPMYAEQQLNAFQLVVELGLAVEIKMDYRRDRMTENEPIVSSAEIKRGIISVMEEDSDIRKKVKEMSEKSRNASVMSGGSSHSSLRRFITDVIDNVQ